MGVYTFVGVVLECIPHLREYFVHPAEVRDWRYMAPYEPGASMSIVGEEEAARIMRGGKPTLMHVGNANMGDA